MKAAVVEDQALVRDYLASLLRKKLGASTVVVIGSLAQLDAREAELAQVALILFDVDLGDGTTLDWAVRRCASGATGAMVALSSISGAFPYKQLQAAGISLVHKNDGEGELLNVIRQTLSGAVVVSRGVQAIMQAAGRDSQAPFKVLSPRELQVLALLGQRMGNDDIAALLGCSQSTATDHRKRIMRKLGLHAIEEVIDYAIRHGVTYESTAAAFHSRRRP